MAVSPLDFPASTGDVVQQRHADHCEAHGHATTIVDGVDQGTCPRCGEVTAHQHVAQTTPRDGAFHCADCGEALPSPFESQVTRIARVLIDGALHDGGATVWQGETADHGYLVGIPGHALVFATQGLIVDPAASLRRVAAWVAATGNCENAATWGAWTANGLVYFDISSHHAVFDTAVTVCTNRAELAFWSVAENVECRP